MIGKLNMRVNPGIVMGPNTTREFVTSLRCDTHPDYGWVTTFRHAQTTDFYKIDEPRSVTEHAMMQVQQSIFGPVRSTEEIQYKHSKDIGKIYGGDILPAKLSTGRGRNG